MQNTVDDNALESEEADQALHLEYLQSELELISDNGSGQRDTVLTTGGADESTESLVSYDSGTLPFPPTSRVVSGPVGLRAIPDSSRAEPKRGTTYFSANSALEPARADITIPAPPRRESKSTRLPPLEMVSTYPERSRGMDFVANTPPTSSNFGMSDAHAFGGSLPAINPSSCVASVALVGDRSEEETAGGTVVTSSRITPSVEQVPAANCKPIGHPTLDGTPLDSRSSRSGEPSATGVSAPSQVQFPAKTIVAGAENVLILSPAHLPGPAPLLVAEDTPMIDVIPSSLLPLMEARRATDVPDTSHRAPAVSGTSSSINAPNMVKVLQEGTPQEETPTQGQGQSQPRRGESMSDEAVVLRGDATEREELLQKWHKSTPPQTHAPGGVGRPLSNTHQPPAPMDIEAVPGHQEPLDNGGGETAQTPSSSAAENYLHSEHGQSDVHNLMKTDASKEEVAGGKPGAKSGTGAGARGGEGEQEQELVEAPGEGAKAEARREGTGAGEEKGAGESGGVTTSTEGAAGENKADTTSKEEEGIRAGAGEGSRVEMGSPGEPNPTRISIGKGPVLAQATPSVKDKESRDTQNSAGGTTAAMGPKNHAPGKALEREPSYVSTKKLAGGSWQEAALWGVERACLVPIRLDVEVEGVRLVDSFTWNLHEQQFQITPEAFAVMTCTDLRLPRSFEPPVAASVREQLQAFKLTLPGWLREGTIAPTGESLHPIHIDIRFQSMVYRDRLEWDLNCVQSSPEALARRTTGDLSLPQEIEPAIAFTIHEQLMNYRQAILGSPGARLLNKAIVKEGGEDKEPEDKSTSDSNVPGNSGSKQSRAAEDLDTCSASGVPKKEKKRVRTMPPVPSKAEGGGPGCVRHVSQWKRWGPCLSYLQPADQYELNSEDWKTHRPTSSLTQDMLKIMPPQLSPQAQEEYRRSGRGPSQTGWAYPAVHHKGVRPSYSKNPPRATQQTVQQDQQGVYRHPY
ncbi:unnamed protein product [Discosporangium mesarthrocarpum]